MSAILLFPDQILFNPSLLHVFNEKIIFTFLSHYEEFAILVPNNFMNVHIL